MSTMPLPKSPIDEVMDNLIAQGLISDPRTQAQPESVPAPALQTQPGASPIETAMTLPPQAPQSASQVPQPPQATTPQPGFKTAPGASPAANTAPSVISIDPNDALAPDFTAPTPGQGAPELRSDHTPTNAPTNNVGANGLGRPPREAERLGLIGRIRQRPGGSRALLTFGAHLLSGQNFFQSLGQGALAYQNVLDEEAERARPQTSVISDGAFTQTYDPNTREYSFNRTPVAAFQEAEQQRKIASALAIAQANISGRENVANTNADNRLDVAGIQTNSAEGIADSRNATDIQVAQIRAESARQIAAARAAAAGQNGNGNGRPPPASILGQANEYRQSITTANASIQRGTNLITMLQRGDLPLDIVNRTLYQGTNLVGIDSQRATQYRDLQTFKQELANAILMNNKGVQTDGDANRAIEQLGIDGGVDVTVAAIRRAVNVLDRQRRAAHASLSEINDNYPTVGTQNGSGAATAPAAPQRQSQPRSSGRTSTGVGWRVVG